MDMNRITGANMQHQAATAGQAKSASQKPQLKSEKTPAAPQDKVDIRGKEEQPPAQQPGTPQAQQPGQEPVQQPGQTTWVQVIMSHWK